MVLSAGARLKIRLRALVVRITRNRLTFVFFLFAFFHCFAQGMVQSFQFTLDANYSAFFTSLTKATNIDPRAHAQLLHHGDNLQFWLCHDIPHKINSSCSITYDTSDNKTIDVDHISGSRGLMLKELMGKSDVSLTVDSSTGLTLESPKGSITLSQTCVNMLLLPAQRTQNSRREDLMFVLLQFWLFGISLVAMIRDSVPHVLAGLSARILLTAWSSFILWRSPQYQDNYRSLIEAPGTPCSAEIFAEYFQTRFKYEIIDVILNCTALLISAYLSFALLKIYNTESFNCVGAPPKITRIHRYFMAVKVVLQLEAFISLTAFGLWTDQIFNTYIRHITNYFQVFVSAFIVWIVVLVPWIITGWYGIRYEHRRATTIFIFGAFLNIICFVMLFYSEVYRWTYSDWPNFACYTTASLLLLIASCVLGILCRMNFGQGLSQYLHAEEALQNSDFAPETFEHDIQNNVSLGYTNEKTKDTPIPTFYTLPTLAINGRF